MIQIRLVRILPGYKGQINSNKYIATIMIPANDRPYGDVILKSIDYKTEESDGKNNSVQIDLQRL